MIAPNSADIIDTIINVKAHPNSAAASEKGKQKIFFLFVVLCFIQFLRRYNNMNSLSMKNNNFLLTNLSSLDRAYNTHHIT